MNNQARLHQVIACPQVLAALHYGIEAVHQFGPGPLRDQRGALPSDDNLGSSLDGEVVKALARGQATQHRDLVRSESQPPQFVETAQHPVRPLTAVASSPHLLAPPRIVEGERTR